MSMPKIPEEKNRPNLCEVTIDILKSVALEETALSHILNAEGEKSQAIIKQFECCNSGVSFSDLYESIRQTEKTLSTIIMKEWLLLKKMETAFEINQKMICKPEEKPCRRCQPPSNCKPACLCNKICNCLNCFAGKQECHCKSKCPPDCNYDCKFKCPSDCNCDCKFKCPSDCNCDCKSKCPSDCNCDCKSKCPSDCNCECRSKCSPDCNCECKIDKDFID